MRGNLLALVLAWGLLAPLPTPALTHATRGVVSALSRTQLVITRSRNLGPITFTVSPATRVDGPLVVGVTVSVRYRDERNRHIATAIAVEASIKRN